MPLPCQTGLSNTASLAILFFVLFCFVSIFKLVTLYANCFNMKRRSSAKKEQIGCFCS